MSHDTTEAGYSLGRTTRTWTNPASAAEHISNLLGIKISTHMNYIANLWTWKEHYKVEQILGKWLASLHNIHTPQQAFLHYLFQSTTKAF